MAPCFSQRRLRVPTASCHTALWEMGPRTLLLLSVLTPYLTRHVQCLAEGTSTTEFSETFQTTTVLSSPEGPTPESSHQSFDASTETSTQTPMAEGDEDESDSGIFVIVAVAIALTLFLVGLAAAAAVLIRRRRKAIRGAMKEDPCLDGGGEKVPMPKFEDDVPSVMELEMEDLEKWITKGDGEISTDNKHKQFS